MSSFRLFSVDKSGLQIIKYFSHRHKLHRLETGLYGVACFNIFQDILKSVLVSFNCQMCLLSSASTFDQTIFIYLCSSFSSEHSDSSSANQLYVYVYLSIYIYISVCISHHISGDTIQGSPAVVCKTKNIFLPPFPPPPPPHFPIWTPLKFFAQLAPFSFKRL